MNNTNMYLIHFKGMRTCYGSHITDSFECSTIIDMNNLSWFTLYTSNLNKLKICFADSSGK